MRGGMLSPPSITRRLYGRLPTTCFGSLRVVSCGHHRGIAPPLPAGLLGGDAAASTSRRRCALRHTLVFLATASSISPQVR